MITLNLTPYQYYLVMTGLDLLYEEDLKEIDYYASREHFNKVELDANIKEADDITDLIKFIRSCFSPPGINALVPEGGEG